MSKLLIYCLIIVVWCKCVNSEVYNKRPKIQSSNGNIILEAAYDKSIYLHTHGPKSTIYLGDVDYKSLYNISSKNNNFYPLDTDDNVQSNTIQPGILTRIENLESLSDSLSSNVNLNLSRLYRRVQNLNTKVQRLQSLLDKHEECRSHPCVNGGTCLDLISGYYCLCPSNWKGVNCDEDVNECYNYAGTDLGCQNGAKCINRPGSYECICKPGWYGIDCTRKEKDCSQGNFEMCGHGVCVPTTTGQGITCICNQGWTTGSEGIACLTDINECESSRRAHCSVNPRVDCINTPGSFQCGPCPAGYEGDGFACYDVDECLTSNGGCSTNPMVLCHNTIGSRICGPCPSGYQGDGVTCTWRGSCSINRGGCHPSAQCVENSLISGITQCVCPSGMVGDGIGLHGCYITGENSTNNCDSNPCGTHGHCHPLREGFTCICYLGYEGARCERPKNLCSNNPCHNGGTCRLDERLTNGYRCECTALYSGELCQVHSQPCGGVLDSEEGSIIYPRSNATYSDNARCAWVIHTDPDKVINVTFTKFKLEDHSSCNYDFVQIHDGRSSASQLIGRFCGSNFPNGGNIISSHNNLYFWFRSDHSVAKEGFSLHWTSIAPVCGGEINAREHGHISSPGSPGTYPPNRDCYWHLITNLGKRIQLHFFELDIEVHANCSFDYLAIYDGERTTDPLLNKYCNSTQPAPLLSAGSEILIHFHSDKLGNGKGFQISYAPVEGVPGCGGLFTTDNGEITSPSYNNNYLPNLLCEYRIRTRRDTKIKIEIKNLNLERSFKCRYDYLQIYDGPSEESRFVAKICDNTGMKKFISTTNNLFIIFRSDHSVAGEGFKIAYQSICEKMYTQDSGVITSPEYPMNYPKQTSCYYIISTTPGKAIVLTFQDFDIEDNRYYECRYDFIEIRDGPSINSTSMGRFCGDSETSVPTQTSTHNFMFIHFKSDVSISGRGFYANYTTIDTECGGIYKNATGTINHPSGDNALYSNSQSCTWMIIAPEGMHIKLEWSKFILESMPSCNSDYVEILEYDENNFNISLGKYCGPSSPPAITTSSNRISINFKSDASIRHSGFSVSYSFLDEKTHCGGLFVKSHGFIYSPGWPLNYAANRECQWTITVPVGHQVVLNITNFELERPYSEKCDSSDYLAIWDGATENSSLINKLCGYIKYKRITTTANSVHLKFHSDAYINGKGFRIEWDGSVSGCGGTLTGVSGAISSPNYPQNYYENAECFYRIVTSMGSRIQIHFSELDLERTQNCNDDYVEIFDGRDSNSVSFGKHCFLSPQINNIETSSNYAFIKFRSDIFISGKGFLLNYNTICNNNISGSFGVIESPGYPNNYPADSNCLWTITVPRGNKINVTFTHFNIVYPAFPHWTSFRTTSRFRPPFLVPSCTSSYLQFKESLDESYSDKKCGSALPTPISTRSNSFQIKFVSGHSFTRTGFRLEWVSYGCGGHIQKRAGVVSMDKNMLLSGELECEWIIETPLGTAVTITFTEIYMTESKNCSIDALELYNGQSRDFPLLSKICTRGLATVQTTSNFLFIRLVKSSPMRDVYFLSHFNSVLGGCGGKISAPFGIIHSKNYPMNYDNNLDCVWLLSVPKYHRIELNFLTFDLYYTGGEDDEDDCGDSIKIYDGVERFNSNYSFLICPKSNISIPIVTDYSVIKLQFTSDTYGSAKGFKLNFTMTCGAVITATSDGVISSAKFINHHKTNCTWIIKAPNLVDKIKFTITHISLPQVSDIVTNRKCQSSYLKVLDGNDESAPLIEEFCGRKSPPVIVSQGNVITVQLGTYTDNLSGQFSAHYSTLTNACGGSLSSEEGSIASPNYPRSYPSNINCEWTISTVPGNRVYVTFENFDLEYSENCNEDYLEIRENNGAGKLLAVYCGQDTPVNTTIGTKLYLKFHSDNKDAGQGFLMHYGFLHGNEITGVKKGEIASPLYPLPYEGQGEYTWRIMTSTSTTITLNINRLEIIRNGEVCSSRLTVYDGYDVNAPIIEELCGYLTSDKKVIQTTSSVVYIILTLDDTNVGALFHISWSESSKNVGNNDINPEINCGNNDTVLVSAKNGSILFTSPNYPFPYGTNLKCAWIFKTTAGRHLSLSFNDISLEESPGCFADYMSIYSLTQTEWTLIEDKICLSETEKKTFESTSTMKVTFTSDGYESRKGFKGSIKSLCGGVLQDKSGIIEVTWSDFQRKPTFNCNWTVKVRPGRTIKMNFIHFNITNTNDCTTYVIIRNGENVESPLLGNGKFCGYAHEDRTSITSSSNAIYVSYVAALSLEGIIPKFKFQTFKLFYEEKNIECGVTSSLSHNHKWEIINSPNYPSIPVPYTECVWIFTGPPGEILRIDFLDYFRLESSDQCTHESIEIRDGTSELSPLKRRLCKEQPETIKTSSNSMFIKYSTQIAEPKNGFKANVSIDICGGTIIAQTGEISSPGYPHMPVLPWGTVCKWHIISVPRHFIQINLKDIKLPESEKPCETKLTFEEWSTNNGTYENNILQQFCDDDFIDYSKSIETLTNNITIKLTLGKPSRWTEVSESRGFRFTFNSSRASCSGTFKTSEGFLTSPGYPRETILRHCQWIIELPDTTRRVRVELLDYDSRDLIGAFNDLTYSCPITLNSQNSSSGISKVFESTGHRLLLYVAISTRNKITRFKAKFSSDESALCGGNLNGIKGQLQSPDLQMNFVCEWRYSETKTYLNTKYKYNTIFVNLKITSSNSGICRSSDSRLNFKAILGVGEVPFLQNSCGNSTEIAFSIPASNMLIKATQFKQKPLSFDLHWSLNPCGGVVHATQDAMNIIDVPNNFNETIDCAWVVVAPVGVRIELKLEGSFNFECTDEYLKIYRGFYQSTNDVGSYCKNKYQEKPVAISFKNTLVYYHSKPSNKTNIRFVIKTVSAQCGGYLMHYDRSFSSPNYPNSYENNKECIWEIQADTGYSISLQFIDRFVVEDTKNCTKDVIIIYDFIDNKYHEINRTCGRTIPPSFNSTSNKMKVIFRTDSDVTLDGFRAKWQPICGGTYIAKEKEQYLYSPGYLNEYSNSLHCTYEIKSIPNHRIILKFLDFDLEGTYPACEYDNLTISLSNYYTSNVVETFCGNEMPPLYQSSIGATIDFNTDRYIHKRGFKLLYSLYNCGGNVTEPTTLTSGPSKTYSEDTNCTWVIEAPADKVIVAKFIYIDLESSFDCYSDYIAVYEGSFIDDEKRLSLMCGHVNTTTYIKGRSNKMVLQFISDSNINYGGFKAEIFFTYSESVGCGGTIDLTSDSRKKLKSPLIGKSVVYENYLGCNWIITAPVDHLVKVDFISFHIAPCEGVNQTSIGYSKCECDSLELQDGSNPNSLVIATYCGHVLPPQITSSSNAMTIRLVTDGEIMSSGFEIELTAQPSVCGQSAYKISNKVQTIKSPGYDTGVISRGIYCNYYLDASSEPYTNIHIRVKNLDLEAGNDNSCNKDKLVLYSQPLPRNSTYGREYILNDGSSDFLTRAMYFYDSTIKYPKRLELCGLKKAIDYYVSGNAFISVKTTGETTPKHKGVELEVSYVGICGRNHTELQARIQALNAYDNEQQTQECYTLITVPETYTITLHFLYINILYWEEKSYLEIFDGNTTNAHSLIKITNNFNFEDHPIYSTQRYMLLHNHIESGQAITYDLNYIATNKSTGCGGKMLSDSGRFTSPFYPHEYRRVSTCEWEIETPVGTRIMLHFVAFDLGVLCEQNYLSLIDRNQNTITTFCSEFPADYKSNDNYVKVAFTTTMNNGGTGWVIDYISII